ncbi:myelin-associated oligodendrocyte basic protein [Rhynchospora pubera]|uniref:Myelin-associated oligodendrocyte basic protein n=1 Tax=Rhynchospora pubera TaxID=906938 RepID=A0AAV8FKW8_9POAL|nr:myelin-associated oligodendrocyte basic protein [Rhynchospora pubera]
MAIASLPETASSLLEPPKLRPSSLKFHPLHRASSLPLCLFPFTKHHHHQIRFTPHSSLHSNLRALQPQRAASQSISTQEDPLDKLLNAILKTLNSLKKPAIAAVLLGVLVLGDPYGALAASGGRIGGSSFSSRSSRGSSSHSSWSYSAPAPSYSSSFYSAPFYSSPFVPMGPVVSFGFGAGSNFLLIMMGFMAFLFLTGFLSDSSEGSVLTETQKTSVIKLQVGLLGMARSFQRDLDQLAEKADTSTPAGLSYVLTETTLALLRHPDCCISAYSSVDIKRSVEGGEKRFNQLSIEERGKFDEETLVNVNNIKRHKSISQRSTNFSNEYIVITILAAAEGVHKLPVINSSSDLKIALQKLGSIPSSKLMAVEVLWTPQNEGDTLSERELLEDYPLLRPL